MTTNGIDLSPAPELLAPERLAILRAEVLAEQRVAVIREREALTIRYRVQKRIGAEQTQLDALAKGLEQCELALLELDVIAREWGQSNAAD